MKIFKEFPDKSFEIDLNIYLPKEIIYNINASVIKYNQNYYGCYRTSNLELYDAKNFLAEFDCDFNLQSNKQLNCENGNTAFEDVRLFLYNDEILALYTYFPYDKNIGWSRSYGVGIGVVDMERCLIIKQQSLRNYAQADHSKNWIPYICNNHLYLITDFSPKLKILKGFGHAGFFTFEEYLTRDNAIEEWQFGQIRGGTPLIYSPLNNDHFVYGFVHSHIEVPNGLIRSRFYLYTMVRFDTKNLQFSHYNLPLGFSKGEENHDFYDHWKNATDDYATRVVFPMGIINYENGILMSFGKDDFVSRLKYFTWDQIFKFFE